MNKNCLFILGFLFVSGIGSFVWASEALEVISVRIKPIADKQSQTNFFSFPCTVLKDACFEVEKKEWKNKFSIDYEENDWLCRLEIVDLKGYDQSSEKIKEFVKFHSDPNHFFLPATVVLNNNEQPKKEFLLSIGNTTQIMFKVEAQPDAFVEDQGYILRSETIKMVDEHFKALNEDLEKLFKEKKEQGKQANFGFRAKFFVVGLSVAALLAVMCWLKKDYLQDCFGR